MLESQLVTLSVSKEEKMAHFVDEIDAIEHFRRYRIQLFRVR